MDLSDKVVRRIVSKDDNSRLQHELSLCQSKLSEDDIKKLQRYQLIGFVTLLRQLNKATTSCRNKIDSFDPDTAVLHPKDNDSTGMSLSCSSIDDVEEGEAKSSSKTLVISDPVSHSLTSTKDSSVVSFELLQEILMKERAENERIRDKKDKLKRNEKERMREEQDRIRKEEKEDKERVRREEREDKERVRREEREDRERIKEREEKDERDEKENEKMI